MVNIYATGPIDYKRVYNMSNLGWGNNYCIAIQDPDCNIMN